MPGGSGTTTTTWPSTQPCFGSLEHAVEVKAKSLRVYSDSEVVVKQMTGEYTCQSFSRLYSLDWVCRKLAHTLKFSISHIRREFNSEANDLANHAVRLRGGAQAETMVP